ncbi:MAG: co-chaperone GroES, partial [Candidatus Omnitrophica bacterium]|nr:co-chaperone GroES [Candidatus Omnitrophota bacterium]
MATATAAREQLKLRPIGDKVIAQRLGSAEKTKTGLYLPDSAQEKPQEGKVIAVGSGRTLKNGKIVHLAVKAGDRIIFGKYSGSEIKLDDKEYVFLSEDDILA